MKKQYKFIIDLDGTLYKFDKGKTKTFIDSQFYADLRKNIIIFFTTNLMLKDFEAVAEYERIYKKYEGEMSIGIEKEYGFDRYRYYDLTWSNLKPEKYIEYNPKLRNLLDNTRGNIILLTAAPKIWTDKVLNFLNLKDLFGEFIFTGEPDLRKPSPQVFRSIASNLGVSEELVFSIGDQEETDIIPAKSVGMKTIRIGFSPESVADFQAPDIKTAIKLLNVEGYL